MQAMIHKIRECVRAGAYEITAHADEEAQEDDVTVSDIKNAILTGVIVKRYIADPRGTRYKLSGKTLDGRQLLVICRFNDLSEVRVITVFVAE